jgi:hypothetical protein
MIDSNLNLLVLQIKSFHHNSPPPLPTSRHSKRMVHRQARVRRQSAHTTLYHRVHQDCHRRPILSTLPKYLRRSQRQVFWCSPPEQLFSTHVMEITSPRSIRMAADRGRYLGCNTMSCNASISGRSTPMLFARQWVGRLALRLRSGFPHDGLHFGFAVGPAEHPLADVGRCC